MKTKIESKIPVTYNKYSAQFKEQGLERVDRNGITTVAKDLGAARIMRDNGWRAKAAKKCLKSSASHYNSGGIKGLRDLRTPSIRGN